MISLFYYFCRVKTESKNSNMDTSEILHINMPTFDKVINSGLVLVDFWAEWCQPCKLQDPYLAEVAKETPDSIIVAKINVDDNRYIARQQGVRNIPTMILYDHGKPVERLVGVQSKEMIMRAINKHIKV
jgi:thioredoxin 1